jgi:hypothetical protein
MNRLLCTVLADPAVATALAQYGLQVEGSTPQHAAERVRAHLLSWRAHDGLQAQSGQSKVPR